MRFYIVWQKQRDLLHQKWKEAFLYTFDLLLNLNPIFGPLSEKKEISIVNSLLHSQVCPKGDLKLFRRKKARGRENLTLVKSFVKS